MSKNIHKRVLKRMKHHNINVKDIEYIDSSGNGVRWFIISFISFCIALGFDHFLWVQFTVLFGSVSIVSLAIALGERGGTKSTKNVMIVVCVIAGVTSLCHYGLELTSFIASDGNVNVNHAADLTFGFIIGVIYGLLGLAVSDLT